MNFSILHKSLFKETFIYTATDMIGKAMSFVLLPFLSFYLPPTELGIATNFTVLTSLVILLAGLAIVNSLPYFFYEQSSEENTLLVSNLIIMCTVLCILMSGLFLIIHHLVTQYLQLNIYIQLLSIIFVFGSLLSQISLIIMRLENDAKSFAYLQIIQIVLHAVVVVLFVIFLKGGGIGKIYAEVLVFVMVGLAHFCILWRKRYIRFSIDLKWIKKLLRFGVPLLPHSISFWFKSGTDKIFITTFCGLQANGLYSMALSISSLFTMLTNSFFNAYTPYLQKRLVQIESDGLFSEKKKIVKQIYLIYSAFFLVGILAVVGSWLIFKYMIDIKYMPAFKYMPYIILAYFIYTFYNFAIQFIYKMKKTLIMGVITFTGSLLQMFFSYWFIKYCGLIGAVYSLLIGNLIITIGIVIYSNSVYKMPWIKFYANE